MNLQEAIEYLKAIRMFGATLGFSDEDIINLALLKKEEENQLREKVEKFLPIGYNLTVTEDERKLVEMMIVYRRLSDVSYLSWVDFKTGKISEEEFLSVESVVGNLYDEIRSLAEKVWIGRIK